MTPVSEVIAAILDKLRGVDELVQAAGNVPENIYAYSDMLPPARSISEAAAAMQYPSMMLALTGISMGMRGGLQAWRFGFELFMCLETIESQAPGGVGYYEAFRQFVDGVPAGETLRLMDVRIHNSFDPIEDVSLERAVSDDGTETWSIKFALTEIGG